MQNITRQAKSIYRLLANGKSLTAAEISSELRIFSNAVYRSVKVLKQFGFVHEVGRYPIRYQIQQPAGPISAYTTNFREQLTVSLTADNGLPKANNHLDVSFISDRAELLAKTNSDFESCAKEVCLIVSGLEVPAETVLEYKKAIDRGIQIRVIVQNLEEVKREMLESWQKMGIKVRHYPSIEARIFVFDTKIAYITSYNPKLQKEGVGTRFEYPPVAAIMQNLFEQRWKKAQEIN